MHFANTTCRLKVSVTSGAGKYYPLASSLSQGSASPAVLWIVWNRANGSLCPNDAAGQADRDAVFNVKPRWNLRRSFGSARVPGKRDDWHSGGASRVLRSAPTPEICCATICFSCDCAVPVVLQFVRPPLREACCRQQEYWLSPMRTPFQYSVTSAWTFHERGMEGLRQVFAIVMGLPQTTHSSRYAW